MDDHHAIHGAFEKIMGRLNRARLEDDDGRHLIFELDSAYQGEEALTKAIEARDAGRPFELAFVDVRMPPGWDGVTTLRRIWEECPELHAVICSAHNDYSWRQLVEELGTTDRLLLVPKPFQSLEIQQATLALAMKRSAERRMRRQLAELERALASLAEESARRTEAEARASYQALHDTLTGLPNRRMLIARAESALRSEATPEVGAMAIDIDGFGLLTAALSPEDTDRLIQNVAGEVSDLTAPTDTVGRSGPDEFVIVRPAVTEPEALEHLARQIQGRLAGTRHARPHLTASIGLSVDHAPTSGEVLLRQAGAALRDAKNAGGRQVRTYHPSMGTRSSRQVQLVEQLRRSIGGDGLRMMYQPIVALETLEIIGFEALARWNHPTLGPISPAEFIPLAETSGTIVPLGRWALRQALSDIAVLERAAGRELEINVNVSAVQLTRSNLVADVDSAVASNPGGATRLKLELTESATMHDRVRATEVISAIRERGVRICIDDFGTGYSSLSHVDQLPIDVLKLDRSITSRVLEDHKGLAIVKTVIALCRALSLDCVAEGIETDAQTERLRELSCSHGQGYVLAKPLVSEDAAELLERARTDAD